MKIVLASKSDIAKALRVATHLPDWFTAEGLKNLQIDFTSNTLLVAKNNKTVVGFLCYTSYSGKMLLLWMGVEQAFHRQQVGSGLLARLQHEAKRLRLHAIEVETLSDADEYEPYKRTHAFYAKHGFKKIFYKKARIKGWDDQVVLEKVL